MLTYQPDCGDHTRGAPGPIFIHAEPCERYEGTTLPPGLRQLPLVVEGRTHDGRILRWEPISGEKADDLIREYLGDSAVDLVTLRHGEAGCFISRIDRV